MRTLTKVKKVFKQHEDELRLITQYNVQHGKPQYHKDLRMELDPETLASIIAKELVNQYRDRDKAYHCDEMEMMLTIEGESAWLKFTYILEFNQAGKPVFFRWMPESPFRKNGQPLSWKLTTYENLNDLVVEYYDYFNRQNNNNQKSKR